jgi:hypothetical protein
MKFYLDTANLDEICQGASLGILDGVTRKPTLAAKEKKPFCGLIPFKHPITGQGRKTFLKDCGEIRAVLGEIAAPEAMRKGAR